MKPPLLDRPSRSGLPWSIDHRRRHFVGTAALTVAATQFGMIGAVDAQSGKARLPIYFLKNDGLPKRS
jgi:hypothetical protein